MNSSTSNSRRLIACFIGAVAATCGVLIGASEWLVRTKAAPQDTFFKHVALFNAASSPFVAFGDSHVARGFDAAAPVVNLGYFSENIDQIAWKADRYLESSPHPQIVLLQADPHLFSSYRVNAGLNGYPASFADSPDVRLLSLSDHYRPQLVRLWRTFFANGGAVKSKVTMTEQGAMLTRGDLARWPRRDMTLFAEERAALHRPVSGFEDTAAARTYKKLIQDFRDAGAEVCLVAFPVAPAYRDLLYEGDSDAQQQFNRAIAFFKSFESDPGVRFVDHRSLYDELSLYLNPDHLNAVGASEYGPVLQSDCFSGAGDSKDYPSVALKG